MEIHSEPESAYALSENTQLQTLVLRHTFRENWELSWVKIANMLRSITSTSLHSIELVFTILRASVTDNPGGPNGATLAGSWGPINDVLARECFRNLEKAKITLDWRIANTMPRLGEAIEPFQKAVQEGMRQLAWHKRGIMTITHVGHAVTLPPRLPGSWNGGPTHRKQGATWDDVWSQIAAQRTGDIRAE